MTEQPKELYNLKDTIKIPLKITTLTDISDLFTLNLICNGLETEVYKEYLFLESGEETERKPSIPLIESFIGRTTGTCKIKATLGEETHLTREFTISDFIKIELKDQQTEVKPGEEFAIELEAIKENGGLVNGFMEITIIGLNHTGDLFMTNTIKNGYGYETLKFPASTKANQYLISINVSEKDTEGKTTNKGFIDYNIKVLQVPTSLEIILDNFKVEPDTSAKIKTVLHDQTGEPMDASSFVTIKNSKEEIIQEINYPTNEFLDVPITYKEPAAEWTIIAESENFTTESLFEIIEKARVDTIILNKTLVIINTGNVFYNNTIKVEIANSSLDVYVKLDVDESKKYLLSAPDGNYEIGIITEEGDNQVVEGVSLTGKIISIKEASEGAIRIIRHPISWLFILAILSFVVFTIYKKGYRRSFFGHINIPFAKKLKAGKRTLLKKNSLLTTNNKAELTLSLKGNKQNASLVCMKVKNLKEIQSKKSNAEETLQKIVGSAEEKKAAIYENQENIFFLISPVKTKTFSNERAALELAQKIEEILKEHNQKFQEKIEAGISVNLGTIVAKQEGEILKFMSMGTLITTAKKIAAISEGEILLGAKMKDKLASNTKTQKEEKDGTEYYSIKEIKNPDKHKKFISNFLKRLEGDKKEEKK
ncbi:hypothetical protein CMI44_01095 [Candidatus Pacearchaeota archaeon]|nr:hypothetical protein [Candidatus Pacearchaeota archaeon]